jgi:signal transduction histidine kinase
MVRQDLGVMTRPLMHAIQIRLGLAIGLLFLIGPIADLLGNPRGSVRTTAILLCTCVFVLIYGLLLPPSPLLRRLGRAELLGPLAALPVLAIVVLAIGAPVSLTALFVYVVAAAGLLVAHASSSEIATFAIVLVAIGSMMGAFARKIATNQELHLAREELAVLAVSEERLRIARPARPARPQPVGDRARERGRGPADRARAGAGGA